LQAGAESGTAEGLVGLCHFNLVARRGVDMATGALGSWLVMERVTWDGEGSFVGGTLGRLGGLLSARTLGTPSVVCDAFGVGEVAAVMSNNSLRSVMSWVGAVIPLSAVAHTATACMSLSVGVRDG